LWHRREFGVKEKLESGMEPVQLSDLMDKYEVAERLEGGEDPVDLSIEKWKRIRDWCVEHPKEHLARPYYDADSCALCSVHDPEDDYEDLDFLDDSPYCIDCPLFEYLGEKRCDYKGKSSGEDGPWQRFHVAMHVGGGYAADRLPAAENMIRVLRECKEKGLNDD
jgi:hypothetical protein